MINRAVWGVKFEQGNLGKRNSLPRFDFGHRLHRRPFFPAIVQVGTVYSRIIL